MASIPAVLPTEITEGIYLGAEKRSAILAVSPARPQRFGNMTSMALTARPKAQIVGAGAAKGASGGTLTPVNSAPIKAHATIRVDQELQWADEDAQLGALRDLGTALEQALAEQIDLAVIHRVSALEGTVVSAIPAGLVTAGAEVEMNLKTAGATAAGFLEQAAGALIGSGVIPNGAVVDSLLAYQIASAKDSSGRPLNPDFPLNGVIDNYRGLRLGVSPSVSGTNVMADSKLRAVVGDFDALRVGLMREIPLTLIPYGDPDGGGDLQRYNQIAIRGEISFSFAILAAAAFGRVVDKVVDA